MSSAAVLVLDVDFRPLRIESWQKVFCDAVLGKVEVVEHSRDKTIKSVNRDYPMPSVVRVLRRFKREKQAIKFSRLNIYSRDAFTCQYCARQLPTEELNFDHVVPRAQGGATTWDNIVTACLDCNTRKGNRTPVAAGMTLLRVPKKPRWLPAVTVDMDRRHVPEEWRPYWSAALER